MCEQEGPSIRSGEKAIGGHHRGVSNVLLGHEDSGVSDEGTVLVIRLVQSFLTEDGDMK